MNARGIDEARTRLRELEHEQRDEIGVAAAALALSLGATQVAPSLAIPLFVGGCVVGGKGLVALWRRWDLIDRLVGDRAAYSIPAVLAFAAREARMDRRKGLALVMRHAATASHTEDVAHVLEALASDLDDERLALDPACAVVCARLADGLAKGADCELSPAQVLDRVQQIRTGFHAS